MKGKVNPGTYITVLLFIFLILFTSFGCWSSRQLEERAYVYAIGVDPGSKEGTYRFSFQIVKPEAFGMEPIEEKAFEVIEAEGETMFWSLRNSISYSGKKLFFPNVKVVIFSKDIAQRGIKPFLDLIARDPEFNLRPLVMVSETLAASVALSLEHKGDKIPAVALEQVAKLREGDSFGIITVKDFILRLQCPCIEPIATLLAVKEFKENRSLYPSGSAVFNGDKMVGTLTERESRGLAWASGKRSNGVILLDDPRLPNRLTMEFKNTQSKITPQISQDKISFMIEIKETSSIGESFGNNSLHDPSFWPLVKAVNEDTIKKDINLALKKSQNTGQDIFGLGQVLYREYPEIWRQVSPQWKNIYQELSVEVITQVNLRNVGDILETGEKRNN